MSRIKYYYDTETCKYEPVKSTLTDVVVNMLGFFAIALILAVGLVFLYYSYYPHPQILYYQNQQDNIVQELALQDKEINALYAEYSKLSDRDTTIYRQIVSAGNNQNTKYKMSLFAENQVKNLEGKNLPNEIQLSHTYKRLDRLRWLSANQGRSYSEIVKVAQQKEQMLASIPAIPPVPPDKYRFASKFGWRVHPITGKRKMHEGIDLSARRGTPIYAAGDGVVQKARRSLGGYGNQIEINHGFGYETKYAHMQKFIVKKGQKVKRGQLIGYVGSTGLSVAPHLHYEIKVNGVKKNPYPFVPDDFTKEKYEELLLKENNE